MWEQELIECVTNVSATDRFEKCDQILANILFQTADASELIQTLGRYADIILNDNVTVVISRHAMTNFIDKTRDRISLDNLKALLKICLTKLQTRSVSFEELIGVVCERLAALHENNEEWTEAAKTLMIIPLQSSQRIITDEYKLQISIKIAQLFLEDDDHVNAEIFLNRATSVVHSTTDSLLLLKHKVCVARVLDYNRRFSEAAQKYLELSYLVFSDSEKEHCLLQAVISTILSAAGPHRSQMLGSLYKDERTGKMPGSVLLVLQRTFKEQLIPPTIIESFSKLLKSHQKAVLADGFTVLDHAMIEHNLLSVSKLYDNLVFDQLASLLNITPEKAEKVAAKMITEQRMSGFIDQVERLIYFRKDEKMTTWDNSIRNLLNHVNSTVEVISQVHPMMMTRVV